MTSSRATIMLMASALTTSTTVQIRHFLSIAENNSRVLFKYVYCIVQQNAHATCHALPRLAPCRRAFRAVANQFTDALSWLYCKIRFVDNSTSSALWRLGLGPCPQHLLWRGPIIRVHFAPNFRIILSYTKEV